jgi:hypothetical protein
MKKSLKVWSVLALLAVAAACSKASPARPSDTTATTAGASVTDASTGITLTTPAALTPTVNQQFTFAAQPITLTVKNAITTGTAPITYTFQVASDAAFASLVSTKDGVAEGAGGTTAQSMDKLGGAKTYFWRVRANTGGISGLFTTGRAFGVGPEVVIQAPAPSSPADGGQLNGTPTLTTQNASRTGPAGTISYRFEVSSSAAFTSTVYVGNVTEGSSGQTSATITAGALTANATYFWRVQASDSASGIIGPFSAVLSFKYVPFSMSQAIIVSSPYDLATWAETAKITSIDFEPDWFAVDFDKRQGPDAWPDTPFGDGSLEYTLGLCVNKGQWYCSAVVQFWNGRELSASGAPRDIGLNWFYDPARWGPIAGYQPQDGESVGVFVCAGNCRNNTAGDRSYVKERSNVAFVPWNTQGGTSYTFSAVRSKSKR